MCPACRWAIQRKDAHMSALNWTHMIGAGIAALALSISAQAGPGHDHGHSHGDKKAECCGEGDSCCHGEKKDKAEGECCGKCGGDKEKASCCGECGGDKAKACGEDCTKVCCAKAAIGQTAPSFTLTDTEGNEVALADYEGKVVVLEWFNPKCPFVVKHHDLHDTMSTMAANYAERDVVWLAINSGAKGKPGNGAELNAEYKEEWNISYPLLLDESGAVGRAYSAKTTPHMYIIDQDGILVYAGAIDNNRSARELGDVNYVKQALDQVLAGETVTEPETDAYGCSVKYAD